MSTLQQATVSAFAHNNNSIVVEVKHDQNRYPMTILVTVDGELVFDKIQHHQMNPKIHSYEETQKKDPKTIVIVSGMLTLVR